MNDGLNRVSVQQQNSVMNSKLLPASIISAAFPFFSALSNEGFESVPHDGRSDRAIWENWKARLGRLGESSEFCDGPRRGDTDRCLTSESCRNPNEVQLRK